jgi:calcium-dependent protein kinase
MNRKELLCEKYITRMMMEVRILQNLDHPNIIKLFEYYIDEENVYAVMEYCAGGDMFKKIKIGGFPEHQAAKIFKQLLSVVNYLHGNKIVHRYELTLYN